MSDVYSKLAEVGSDVRSGRVSDVREGLTALREKYGLSNRKDRRLPAQLGRGHHQYCIVLGKQNCYRVSAGCR